MLLFSQPQMTATIPSTTKALRGMRKHPMNEQLQIQGAMALCRLSLDALTEFVLTEKGLERFIVPAMKMHKSPVLHAAICQCLGNLAYQHKHVVKVWIYTSGVLQEVLEHTMAMVDDDALAHASWLLRNLAESAAIRAGMIQAGVVPAIETALQSTRSSTVSLHGCAALHQLWKDASLASCDTSCDTFPTPQHSRDFQTSWACILSSMASFPKSPGLQEECCGALSVMVLCHPDPIGAVSLLQDAKRNFPIRPALQHAATNALSAIVRRANMTTSPSIIKSQQAIYTIEPPATPLWFPFVPAT